ncbi:MAG: GNAT family N-acetyltransferase [Armatimonadota bacterium]
MIRYVETLEGTDAWRLRGFFEGWPNPPTPAMHRRLLASGDVFVLAIDDVSGDVVGFVTAVTDGILSAYVPFLEVLPAYRRRGIGSELMRRILRRLGKLYMVDTVCDPQLQRFYSIFGMQPASAMIIRNYEHQSGATP